MSAPAEKPEDNPPKKATILPSTARPSTVLPATARPPTIIPSTAKPSTILPSTARPATIIPSTISPSTTLPATHRPSTARATMLPASSTPATYKLSTSKPTLLPSTIRPGTQNATPEQTEEQAEPEEEEQTGGTFLPVSQIPSANKATILPSRGTIKPSTTMQSNIQASRYPGGAASTRLPTMLPTGHPGTTTKPEFGTRLPTMSPPGGTSWPKPTISKPSILPSTRAGATITSQTSTTRPTILPSTRPPTNTTRPSIPTSSIPSTFLQTDKTIRPSIPASSIPSTFLQTDKTIRPPTTIQGTILYSDSAPTFLPPATMAPPNVVSILTRPGDVEFAARQTQYTTLAPSEREKQEQWVQEFIARAGVCPEGFEWNRMEGGYQCRGGGHGMTDELIAEGKAGMLALRSKKWGVWAGPYYPHPGGKGEDGKMRFLPGEGFVNPFAAKK